MRGTGAIRKTSLDRIVEWANQAAALVLRQASLYFIAVPSLKIIASFPIVYCSFSDFLLLLSLLFVVALFVIIFWLLHSRCLLLHFQLSFAVFPIFVAAFPIIYCCVHDYWLLHPFFIAAFPNINCFIPYILLLSPSWKLFALFPITLLFVVALFVIIFCCISNYFLLPSLFSLLLHFQSFIGAFPYYIAAL